MSAIKVFISYTHDSEAHRERVLALSERLRLDGITTILDRYLETGSPPQGWSRWMMAGLDESRYVLCICTETYRKRFLGLEDGETGRGGDWEGGLVTQAIYDARARTNKFIPVLFDGDDACRIPAPLRARTYHVLDSDEAYNTLYDALLDQSGIEPAEVGTLKRRPRDRARPLTFDAVPGADMPVGGAAQGADRQEAEQRIALGLELIREAPRHNADLGPKRVRFVNSAPMIAPRYFEDRETEAELIADFLRDEGACILTLHGRGGVGKTALVCKVLRELQSAVFPSKEDPIEVGSIVYLSAAGATSGLFHQLVSSLILTLDEASQLAFSEHIQVASPTPSDLFRSVLAKLEASPTVVLVDNFEDLLASDSGATTHSEFREMLVALPGLLPHSLKLVLTTQILPRELAGLSPAAQMVISMVDGLPSPYAERVLRRLDRDGQRGLRDAPDAILAEVREVTRGFPRALEGFFQILFGDPSINVADLLTRIRVEAHSIERISNDLVGQAFEQLDRLDQRVMQGLASFGRPVPKVAIEFLLSGWGIYADITHSLQRLAAMHFIRREGVGYHLHPIDRAYALSKLADPERKRLLLVASDYFSEVRRPRSAWETVEDLMPHFEQLRLRLEAQDPATAANILDEVADFLDRHGAFEQRLAIGNAVVAAATDSPQIRNQARAHVSSSLWRLGRVEDSIESQTLLVESLREETPQEDPIWAEANLLIYRRELGVTPELLEAHLALLARLERDYAWSFKNHIAMLSHCSDCFEELGYLDESLEFQQRATDKAERAEPLDLYEAQVHNLGCRYLALADIPRARKLYAQALDMSRESKNPLWKANHLAGMFDCMVEEGRYNEALRHNDEALTIRREISDLDGVAKCALHLARVRLAQGDFAAALEAARSALSIAGELRAPLWQFNEICAEISLCQNAVEAARAYIDAALDDLSGARWVRESLLGTVLMRQGLPGLAAAAFERAHDQSRLWLSRCEGNVSALSGAALATAGIVACGARDRISEIEPLYRSLRQKYPWVGAVRVWQRRLDELIRCTSDATLSQVLSAVSKTHLGPGPA